MLESILYFSIATMASFIPYNLLIKMFTLDSLFNAIYFIITFLNKNLTESQIIDNANNLYSNTILDRYIYYFILYVVYKVFCIFIWVPDCFPLYYAMVVSIIPPIINCILNNYFQIIREKKELYVKIIISKILASILKFYSKIYLDKDVKIKHKEILCLFDDYWETVNYFIEVVKNIGIILALSYIKDYSISLYYGVIKYIYNYKTGNMLSSFNSESAKKYLISIIDDHKWIELKKPNTYKAILHLYQINSDKSEIFKKIITNINITIIKMLTAWTISSLIGNVYIIPLISFCMLCYKKLVKKYESNFLGEIIMILIACLTNYCYNNYFLIGLITFFGASLCFNKMTFIMIKIFTKSIKNKMCKVVVRNKNLNLAYIVTAIYPITIKIFNLKDYYLLLGLNMVINMILSNETKKHIIITLLLLTTKVSDFNIYHIFFNTFVLYIVVGTTSIDEYFSIHYFVNGVAQNIPTAKFIIIYKKYLETTKNKLWNFKKYIYYTLFKKNKLNDELIFELMDQDRFPSVLIEQNKNKYIDDSLSFDDIFSQPEETFIQGISIDDSNNYKVIKRATNIYHINHNYFE